MNRGYNFSMEDCAFYVDEEKRTIACVLEGTRYMFTHYVGDKLYIDPRINTAPNAKYVTFGSSLKMPNRFVGVAKCSEEDEWDEALGKKIAYLRLREKVYRSFFKRANTYIDTLDDWLERSAAEINKMGDKLTREMDSRDAYIAEMLSRNEIENG